MENKLKIIVIALLLNASYAGVRAQINYDIELGTSAGYENNIYHSPSTYRNNQGELQTKKDLIASSALSMFEWEMELSKRFNKHELSLRHKGYRSIYLERDYKNANRTYLKLEAQHEYEFNKMWSLESELGIRRINKLGINILGDELVKPYSHTDVYFSTGVSSHRYFQNRKYDFTFYYKKKKYDEISGEEPSDNNYYELSAEIVQKFGPSVYSDNLKLEVAISNRDYTERYNYRILDPNAAPDDPYPFLSYDPNYNYPNEKGRYFEAALEFEKNLGSGFDKSISPYVEYKRRDDLSQGDYTYAEVTVGSDADFEFNNIEVDLGGSFSNRKYPYRVAELENNTGTKDLRYNYLDFDADMEYALSPMFALTVETDFTKRFSNVTVVDKRTRRSYSTYYVLGGLKFYMSN